ncbi:E3 ubiquitin-protein ligase Rnf220 isoform X1 [Dermacentor silvarum]|uniref:E3 ubiquitin-protein ligase Rnf220 isoform X1 n=1 Tax=Dermacentor silvarum TaxID=543639 RepID=UPI00189B1A94|nr:E3 ubiquitin-protein ligase Rnf220 isoform X1 [Dermacentor silvarum]
MSEDGDTTAADGIASPKPTDCSASDGSPGAASTTVSTADESADVDVEVDDSHARHLRPKRRSVPAATFGCPVCGVTLRQQELQQHWQLEVDRLQGIARNVARRHRSDSTPAGNSNRRNPRREQSLERVRANRDQRRLGTGVHCPVCHVALRGCPERLAEHVNNCLARQEDYDLMDEDDDVDVDGLGVGESFDEYEWAGQSRLRATSLLEGGFRAAGWVTAGTSGGSSSSSSATAAAAAATTCRAANDEDDVDVVLDVDGDAYGRAQFSEADLIPLASSEPAEQRERTLLRQAVLSAAGATFRSSVSPRRDEGGDNPSIQSPEAPAVEKPTSDGVEEAKRTDLDLPKGSMSQVVNSLRERLRQLQEENQAVTKCLICMDPYENPVVSVVCWHVHCQECWLKTLGAKKLCPQCNSITSASDLRRIYL